MVLNPHLYTVLQRRYGEVRVFNENIARVEDRRSGEAIERGESYNVCCPLCGDQKFRLSIGYLWLTKPPLSTRRRTMLANCYNENCDVRSRDFYTPILDELEMVELGVIPMDSGALRQVSQRSTPRGVIPLPSGAVPLLRLPSNHPAREFLRTNYTGLSDKFVDYMCAGYDVRWVEEGDERFPDAGQRIIFPVASESGVLFWQGRAIEQQREPRWLLPPSSAKIFYNGWRVPAYATPILCEGVMNAIVCGPMAVAMFGKTLNTLRAEEFASKWSSVVIATDPDTFVPNNLKGGRGRIDAHDLRDKLAQFITDIRLLRWPEDILELARRRNNGELEGGRKIRVPDAADLGPARMAHIIKESQ